MNLYPWPPPESTTWDGSDWHARCEALALSGSLLEPALRAAVEECLVTLPDELAWRAVQGLARSGRPEVADCLAAARRRLPLARLPLACWLERTLARSFPAAHARWTAADAELLAAGPPVPESVLLFARSQELGPELRGPHAELARQAIEALERLPKALSQAAAEDLLARRVYADPGHFLFELLQNADDAGATSWEVWFEESQVVVWHDGADFDVRDLVGLASIGLSSKRTDQIGVFGVGFKSVFDVCERPEVYSGSFQFELSDVSRPRYRAERPAVGPPDGTLLVLPLKEPRGLELFERAALLDRVVLLTLHHVRRIHWHGPREVVLEAQPQAYRTVERPLVHPDGRETSLMLGEPLSEGAPSLYSYLPTAQRTGLRFFVQARFEVPVDRERILAESGWNRWVLSHVAELFEELWQPERWDLIPLVEEAAAPPFAEVARQIQERLRERECLPGTDGKFYRPAQILVSTPELASLFVRRPVAGHAFLEETDERSRQLALQLGARQVYPLDLVPLLGRALPPAGSPAPSWPGREAARWRLLFDLLLEDLEGTRRRGEARAELAERLSRLALAPTGSFSLHLPAELAGAEGAVRRFLSPHRPLLHEELQGHRLLQRLGLLTLGADAVVTHLESNPEDVNGDALEALLEAEPEKVRELAIFPTRWGRHRLARTPLDAEGALLPGRLGGLYGGERPLLEPEPALEPLLERLRPLEVTFETVLADLEEGRLGGGLELHLRLAEVAEEIPAGVASRLAELPVWPDRSLRLHRRAELRVAPHESLPHLADRLGVEVPFAHRAVDPTGLTPGGLDELLEELRRRPPADPALLRELQDLLVALQVPKAGDLRVWISRGGAALEGDRVVQSDPELEALLPAGSAQRRSLEQRLLDEDAWERFQALGLTAVPAAEFLRQLLDVWAWEGTALAEQEPFLQTLEAVAAADRLAGGGALSVDAAGHLRRGPSAEADGLTRELLGLHRLLAHPDWPEPGPPLSAGRVLAELSEPALDVLWKWLEGREHEVFADPVARARLVEILPSSALLALDQAPPAVRRHLAEARQPLLRKAYAEAASAGQLEACVRWLEELDELPSLLPTSQGELLPAERVLAPAPEHRAALESLGLPVVSPGVNAERLRGLGLRAVPELAELPLEEPLAPPACRALSRLLDLEGLLEALQERRWVLDQTGRARRADELYYPDPELEGLVGSYPDLYPDADFQDRRLGFRPAQEVRWTELVRHLLEATEVSFKLYRALESGLRQGRFPPEELRAALEGQPWIACDDGSRRAADRVLTVAAFRHFGERRGYWERGRSLTELGRLFGIPSEVTPAAVLSWLEEVAASGSPDEPGLARMLRLAGGTLSEAGRAELVAPHWAVVMAHRGTVRELLAPSHPGLYRSDTPSLEALFAGSGSLWLVDPGNAEEAAALDRYYAAIGIPRLRDRVELGLEEQGGRPLESGALIAELRGLVRAVLEVMPRIRAQRAQLAPEGWRIDERLAPLASAGRLLAVEGLQVTYRLPGVGEAQVRTGAAYDALRGALLVDPAALEDLPRGLAECVYQGPGEEQLLDLLEILLPLGTAERMHAYLDRRHFPAAAPRQLTASDWLRERLTELLDWGLEERLGVDCSPWRTAELAEGQPLALWRLLGVEPTPQQVDELQGYLDDPSLLLAEPDDEEEEEDEAPGEWLPPAPAPAPAPAAPRPPSLPVWADGNPLQPVPRIGAQLWATPQVRQRLQATRTPAGLAFTPSRLAWPHLYAVHALGARFEPALQQWSPPETAPLAEGASLGRRVSFSGRLAPGENWLPLPLGARLVEAPAGARLVGGRWQLPLERVTEVRYQAELGEAPRSRARARGPAEWTQPTLLAEELPPAVRRFLAGVPEDDRQLVEAVREFVRQHYLYDESYLLRPEVRQALRELGPGRGHHHLQALHAGADSHFLGRGICYELNLMVVELLRHLEFPALVATAWILDAGWLDRPDHLVALALFEDGPVPVDAATDSRGPMRVLGPARRPAGGAAETDLLLAALALLGLEPVSPDPEELRAQALEACPDLPTLLQVLGGELRQVLELTEALVRLEDQGLVRIEQREYYDVKVGAVDE